jgi:DNA-binding LacI/PurR family transcriptional regulator
MSIPGDLKVVGFDDIADAAHMHPTLTTVHQDPAGQGAAAARLLLELIDDPHHAPRSLLIEPVIVERESTATGER